MKRWDKELADQSIHFGVAFLVVLAVQPDTIWQGALLGLILGAIREITEGGNVLSSGSVRDMIFWTLGGIAAGTTL